MEEEAEFERMLSRNAVRFGQEFSNVFQHTDWRESIPLSSGTVVVTVVEPKLNFHSMLR